MPQDLTAAVLGLQLGMQTSWLMQDAEHTLFSLSLP